MALRPPMELKEPSQAELSAVDKEEERTDAGLAECFAAETWTAEFMYSHAFNAPLRCVAADALAQRYKNVGWEIHYIMRGDGLCGGFTLRVNRSKPIVRGGSAANYDSIQFGG